MADARTQRSLQVGRSRRRLVLLWLVSIAVVGAFGAWYVTHPASLPTSAEPLEVSAPLGEATYVGVYDPAADDGRTLHLRAVSTRVEGTATVAVLVCRDGAVSQTSEPDSFCSSLDEAVGATVGPADTLMLEIVEDQPGTATVGPVRLSFRDGVQWDTQPVGPVVEATFVSR